MKHVKMLCLAALPAGLMAFATAGTASATELDMRLVDVWYVRSMDT